jgi:hypothetical protein
VSSTAQSAVALKNLATNANTSVTLTPTGGYGDFVDNAQLWPGDDRLLMADACDVANAGTPPTGGLVTWVIAGLQAGNYVVYTYALAPDFPATYTTSVEVVGSSDGIQVCTGAWSGAPHVLGVSHARHTLAVGAGQNVTVRTSNASTTLGTNQGTVNGFQIVLDTSTPSTVFCAGDAPGTTCVSCGNNGATGAGCANSSFAAGALLASSGQASLAADTLVLTAARVTGPGLFFQADGLAAPLAFGDGQLCASVGIVRLGVVFPTGSTAAYPGGTTPNPISVAGAPIAAGNAKHYQCWYRDAAAFCTASTFNTSNGVSLTWGP